MLRQYEEDMHRQCTRSIGNFFHLGNFIGDGYAERVVGQAGTYGEGAKTDKNSNLSLY